MRNNTSVRKMLAIACFGFAGLKLYELLQGPGNYAWQDLFSVGIFVALGMLYIYLIIKNNSKSSS
ncbi:hypothetical protein ABID22_002618 [Pontibacter aydingkolensis]|uniref:F0F1-ATPase subunit Ca2+/Mg2+ transporter n=1 Tax=Pontibacter aydingkolensis TaxID=1911536 RepID=A0ABS7CWH6_9BACT|nr:hypothetical protein [Pontibacter aydingkolensis]MBW7468216.1 hypothetical protein [Pontibacter aydingkolensis]